MTRPMKDIITELEAYRAMAIRKGLEFYIKTGLKINTQYTPKNMLKAAGNITNRTYKRGEYLQAIYDLTIYIQNKEI